MKYNNEHNNGHTFQSWSLPKLGEVKKTTIRSRANQQAELERIRKEAENDGYQTGYQQGIAQAQQEMLLLKNQFEQALTLLQNPLKLVDEEVEKILLSMTIKIAQHLIESELSQHPEKILTVLKKAITMIPLDVKKRIVYLHPEDVNFLQSLIKTLDERENKKFLQCEWLADDHLQRGEFRLETENVHIDATFAQRVQQLIHELHE